MIDLEMLHSEMINVEMLHLEMSEMIDLERFHFNV